MPAFFNLACLLGRILPYSCSFLKYPLIVLALFSSIQGMSQAISVPQNEIKKMIDEISAQNLKQLVEKMVSFETRHSLSATNEQNKGIGAAREWVKSEFEKYALVSGGRMRVEMDRFVVKADGNRIPEDVEMANVMAILQGTDSADDRIIIVGAHLDSRATDVMDAKIKAPGANDNASGVAAVMEMARIMSSREFPATLIFIAFQGEEQGLYGATHLAERANREEWNLIAMLNNDIIGNSFSSETGEADNTRVRVFSEATSVNESQEEAMLRRRLGMENDGASRNLARYMKMIGEQYVDQLEVVMVNRPDRFLRGGDHTPFNTQGYAAVRMSEMIEDFDHQHQDVRVEEGRQFGDLPEFMDFEYLRKNTGINLATMASLALAPMRPENVRLITANLTNKTELTWQEPAKGKKPAGYVILMRDTTSPIWERSFQVSGTQAILPYSKDHHFFAIQSVDEMGNPSLPELPMPYR
jgi:hypothetical protein